MSNTSKTIFKVIGALAVAFVGLLIFVWLRPTPNCHVTPSEQVDIVFDKTRGYSPTQAHSVDNTLLEVMTRAADNAEINLYYVTSRPDLPFLVLSECRPSTRGNRIFGDPEQQERNFRRLLVQKLKKRIDLPLAPRPQSPLVESLATITRRRIVTSKLEQKIRVEFDIYSDMVQDSKIASLERRALRDAPLRGAVDPKLCAVTAVSRSGSFTDLYNDVQRFFRDVPVTVYGIYRDPLASPNYPGERCVRTFWEDAFPHLMWMTM